jgi:DNA-directed RNA polymerase subunit RPC12/RpoP
MRSSNEIVNFYFGNEKIFMTISSLIYYPWLSDLFGYGKVGQPKKILKYNLLDYLQGISLPVIRQLIIKLKILSSFYVNQQNENTKKEISYDELIKNEDKYMNMLENFLMYGPGSTKGLDIPYKCKRCSKETMEIPSYEEDKSEYNLLPHEIIEYQDHILCKYCGINWWRGLQRSKTVCIRNYKKDQLNNDLNNNNLVKNSCIHDWE